MWNDFGFKKNLYDTHPIKGDVVGERLLVGREKPLKMAKSRLANMGSVVTIEGPNGVGKTSLLLVAGFQLENETAKNGKSSLILLPEPFQFSSNETALDLKRKVYGAVASHFIKNEKKYRERLDLQFNLNPLTDWLENPLFISGGASILGNGGSIGKSTNTSSGFDVHGFFNIVDRLMNAAFDENGGIICILDNLEILNTSQVARQRLEELRDDLFSKHGFKWVVCGARGIVKSVASSARLQGRLQEPMEIAPLDEKVIENLINSRVQEYTLGAEAAPPVGVRSFRHLFSILNKNLRDTLKFSGDFCLWLTENEKYVPDQDELHEIFEVWLAHQSESYEAALTIPPRSWRLFDDICDQGGVISPSDYRDYEFNSSQSMRGAVAKLESSDLVVSEQDETDHRRKTIAVTAKGWLIRHHRFDYR